MSNKERASDFEEGAARCGSTHHYGCDCVMYRILKRAEDAEAYAAELEKDRVRMLEQIQWMRGQFRRIQELAEGEDPSLSLIYCLALVGEKLKAPSNEEGTNE